MEDLPADVLAMALEALAEQVGMDGLALDETGYCALESDRNEVIHLQWHEDGNGGDCLELSVLVDSLPSQSAADTQRLLLEMNFCGYGSGGGWFALRPGSDEVWYFHRVGLTRLTATMLEVALANCLQRLELWQAQPGGTGRAGTETGDMPAGARV